MRKKVLEIGKRVLKHELINGSIYVFLGFAGASFFNFVLNLYVVRKFSATDYGIYASLLSLYTLFGLLAQPLTAVIVRFVADYFSKNDINSVSSLFFKTYKFISIFALVIFLIFLTMAVPVQIFLKIDNPSYVVLVGMVVSLFYIGIINLSFLQGLLKFKLLSISYILGGIVRLVSAVILISLGLKIYGVFFAIFLATFIPFAFQFIPLRFLIGRKSSSKSDISNTEIFKYALPTSVAIISLMSLTSTDVILVKHFFNSYDAGLYGGLSLIGKIIFYITGPLASVMFPLLIKRHSLGQNFNNLFYLTLLLVSIPSIGIALFYILFPAPSIRLILPRADYLGVIPYLPIFGIFIAIFSLLNVCVNFFLSLKKTIVSVFVASAAILQIILISLFHKDFFEVITVSIFLSAILLVILIIYFLKEFENINRIKKLVVFFNDPSI